MLDFAKNDIVVCYLDLSNAVLGRCAKVVPSDETIYLANPCEVKMIPTPEGIATTLMPLGMFFKELLDHIVIEPCMYLCAAKARDDFNQMYEEFEKKILAQKTGLVIPSAAESRAVEQAIKNTPKGKEAGKILKFRP